YDAQVSTASNFTGTLTSSRTSGVTASFAGLTANSTYYLRVKALGHGGAESSYAVAAASATEPNAPSAASILAASSSTAQLGWNANANPAGSLYLAQRSTASNFSGTLTSSQTFEVSALFSGLAANTTYYLRARTVGNGGSLSAFSGTVSTFTTSAALDPVSAAVVSAASTTLSYSWGDGGNAAGTQYRALVSTTSAFTGGADGSSTTLNVTAAFAGLTANTTYYFKVKALGGLGPDSAYTAALTSSTLAAPPVTAAVAAVATTTAQLGWGANANPAGTLYDAQLSTASNFTGTLTSSRTLGVTALFSGLGANATYYLRVKALGHGGAESTYAVASASATDATAPVTAAVSAVTAGSETLGWGANANPAGTL
ncbi:MAG: cell wall surface anchor family protein, partial [Elusimicrobia bacterium]